MAGNLILSLKINSTITNIVTDKTLIDIPIEVSADNTFADNALTNDALADDALADASEDEDPPELSKSV